MAVSAIIKDRIRHTSTTTGTGNFTLSATIPNAFRAFSAVITNNQVVPYTIANRGASQWESGYFTFASGTPLVLTRVAANVLDGSSGAATLVNFSAGTKDVWLSNPAAWGVITAKPNTWTIGPQTMQTGADANVCLALQRNSGSQSGNLLNFLDEVGGVLALMDPNGNLTVNSALAATGDTNNTGVTYSLTAGHNLSSGTAQIGIGTGFQLQVQDSTTAGVVAAEIDATWADVSHATRKGRLALFAYNLATAQEGMRIEAGSQVAISFFGVLAAPKQTSGANLTNNVTTGGVNDTIANFTDLVTYANDAAAIRNDIYQLARKLKQINDGLRAYGLFT